MRRKTIAASVAALILCCGAAAALQSPESREYKQALSLYKAGMYEQARGMFESLSEKTDDVLAHGYSVLCAVRMQAEGYQNLIDEYDEKFPYSTLKSEIHYLNALNLFDAGNYQKASSEFAKVSTRALGKARTAEFTFKQAYSQFGLGNYAGAISGFQNVEKMALSDYTAPSRYALGYVNYLDKNFDEAFSWFEKSVKDPRFSEMSNYYMLECRFMNKDYRYVVENGVTMYDKVPAERKSQLARLISESYLVLGDSGKAREYYESTVKTNSSMTRSDYFYAGSVLYAVEDFQGAIENFSMMTNRTDSLGQMANYNLGYSYVQTKNKVAALAAFKDASSATFDKNIQEDAYFNYAKLAFDLNHDTSVFNDYIAKYADLKKGDSIYNYMALACLYNHDYAGAVAAYDNIDELDPSMRSNYMKANYLRANQLIGNGSYRDAVACLRAASFFTDKHDTFNQLSRYWLAESYYRTGKFAEARGVFVELYNLSALDGQTEGDLLPYHIAYCDFMTEDYAQAARWFDTFIENGSKEYRKEALERRADCDFIRKDYKKAIEGYQKVLDKYYNANDIYPYYQAGLAYGLDGNKQKKIDVLSRVKDADPSAELYPEAMYELGRAYVAANDYDDAIRCFRTLRNNTTDSGVAAQSLIELGLISNNRGQSSQALDYYKEVVTKMPGTEYAQSALQAIEAVYQSMGESDKYLVYAESIGATEGKSEAEKEMMYFTASEQVFMSGSYQKALASLQNFLVNYPQGTHVGQVDYYMAESYRALGQKENAYDWYVKALEFANRSAYEEAATRTLADLLFSMERYGEAFARYSSLSKVAKIDQNKEVASVGMMRSAFKAGDYTNAISCSDVVKNAATSSTDLVREADYTKAKSLLATSQREAAFELFRHLSRYPSTAEGAEATVILIQDAYDQGDFGKIQDMVYDFAEKAGGQNYWLAKAYLVLGDSFVETDNLTQAKATFESLRDGYTPENKDGDDIADNVAMRLAKLQKLISQK